MSTVECEFVRLTLLYSVSYSNTASNTTRNMAIFGNSLDMGWGRGCTMGLGRVASKQWLAFFSHWVWPNIPSSFRLRRWALCLSDLLFYSGQGIGLVLTFSCSNFCSHEVKVPFFGYDSKLWSLAHLSLVWASTTYWIDSVRNQYVIGHGHFQLLDGFHFINWFLMLWVAGNGLSESHWVIYRLIWLHCGTWVTVISKNSACLWWVGPPLWVHIVVDLASAWVFCWDIQDHPISSLKIKVSVDGNYFWVFLSGNLIALQEVNCFFHF